MLATTTTSERTGHWTKMRRSLASFSGSAPLISKQSSAAFITNMSGRFSVHTVEFSEPTAMSGLHVLVRQKDAAN
jgi:hypothetical protein